MLNINYLYTKENSNTYMYVIFDIRLQEKYYFIIWRYQINNADTKNLQVNNCIVLSLKVVDIIIKHTLNLQR